MLDWIIIVARWFQFAPVLVLFGSALFYFYGLKTVSPHRAWPSRTFLLAPVIALAGTMAWVMAETGLLLGDTNTAFDPASIWWLLSDTRIGQIHLLQLTLLIASISGFWLLSSPRALWITQATLGSAMTASFAWSGHGAKDQNIASVIHLGADILHLFAAGIWIGALIPLTIIVARSLRPPTEDNSRIALYALHRFSGIGPVTVALLIATGLINSWFLISIAHWWALFTTAYGIALTVKLIFFAAMLLLAAVNRYHLSPGLNTDIDLGASPTLSLKRLRTNLLTETALAFLVLAAVAILGTLEPPVSMIN